METGTNMFRESIKLLTYVHMAVKRVYLSLLKRVNIQAETFNASVLRRLTWLDKFQFYCMFL